MRNATTNIGIGLHAVGGGGVRRRCAIDRADGTRVVIQPACVGDTAAQSSTFSKEELAQLVAPVALYPDSLLAQVLMASTYPGDVADAAKWSKAHPDVEGRRRGESGGEGSLGSQRAGAGGIPAGAAACSGTDIAWVQRLGDAFLAQPDDVMDDRAGAAPQGAGGRQPEVERIPEGLDRKRRPRGGQQTIIIESPQPDDGLRADLQPDRTCTAAGHIRRIRRTTTRRRRTGIPAPRSWAGIMWGIGIGIAGGLWGDCDWGGGDIDIDVDRYNNFKRNIDRERRTRRQSERPRRPAASAARQRASTTVRVATACRTATRPAARNSATASRAPKSRRASAATMPSRAQSRDQARQSMERQGMRTGAQQPAGARPRATGVARSALVAGRRRSRRSRAGIGLGVVSAERCRTTWDRAMRRARSGGAAITGLAQQRVLGRRQLGRVALRRPIAAVPADACRAAGVPARDAR